MIFIIPLDTDTVECLYTEEIPLTDIGETARISRASHVEPNETGGWVADLSPVGGPSLGPFTSRSQALKAEINWIENNYFTNK